MPIQFLNGPKPIKKISESDKKKIRKLIIEKKYTDLLKQKKFDFQDLVDQNIIGEFLTLCKSTNILIHMLNNCVDLNCDISHNGLTLLMIFCRSNVETPTIFLINLLLDLETSDSVGSRAIDYACRYGSPQIVKELMCKNVDIHHKDRIGYSIHYACRYQPLEIIKLFCSKQNDLNVKNVHNFTSLDIVCRFRGVDIIEYMLQQNIKIDDPNALKLKVDRNENLNKNDKEYVKTLIISLFIN